MWQAKAGYMYLNVSWYAVLLLAAGTPDHNTRLRFDRHRLTRLEATGAQVQRGEKAQLCTALCRRVSPHPPLPYVRHSDYEARVRE